MGKSLTRVSCDVVVGALVNKRSVMTGLSPVESIIQDRYTGRKCKTRQLMPVNTVHCKSHFNYAQAREGIEV
jgi:hypothetical protein